MDLEFLTQEISFEKIHFKHTVDYDKPTQRRRRLPSPAQLQVQFVCHTQQRYFNLLSCDDEDPTLISHLEKTSDETCRFDLRAVLNNDELLPHISPVLSEFGITEDSDDHRRIVRDIAFLGLIYGRRVIHKKEGRGLIPLKVVISREHEMFRCEMCLLDRVARESAEESERVTVAASESSIKKLLKKRKVRVEEGDSCSVCLEEFRAGTYETSMDCSHVFHKDCIQKWLRESHYCPVCRYEMPTKRRKRTEKMTTTL